MNPWGWKPERQPGVWRHGAVWLRPFAAAVPWLTLVVLLLQFYLVSGTYTTVDGFLFDLPEAVPADAVENSPVALVVPVPRETLVYFDDTRYSLADESSLRVLSEQFMARFARPTSNASKTLLVLADRRVSSGELMRLASLARKSGVERVFFATKRMEAD